MSFETILLAAEQQANAFMSALGAPEGLQTSLLLNSLRHNEDCAFGRHFNFRGITSVRAYQQNVPIMHYAGYEPWIERCVNGEKMVLTADDIDFYFSSSGSTGEPKRIPSTSAYVKNIYLPMAYISLQRMRQYVPGVLGNFNKIINFKWDPISEEDAVSGDTKKTGLSQVNWSKKVGIADHFEPGMGAPWASPGAIVNQLDRLYYRLCVAAVYPDVFGFVGINPRLIATIPYLLDSRKDELLRDVHDGTLLGKPFRPGDPGRAAAIEKNMQHSGQLKPCHIWPAVKLMYCWTGGTAALYRHRIPLDYGNDIQIFSAPVAASEGPVAIPVSRSSFGGPLALPFVFLEFIEATEEIGPGSKTLLYDALEKGKYYHVILTNTSGLYRYALGDIIRVSAIINGVPYAEYAGRNKVLQLQSCRLLETDVTAAAVAAAAQCEWSLVNLSCCIDWDRNDRLLFAVEFDGYALPEDAYAFAVLVDDALCALHPGYQQGRAGGSIHLPVVQPVAKHGFARDWIRRVEAGVRPAQVKDKIFITDQKEWQYLCQPA